jgi:hypothetical protein
MVGRPGSAWFNPAPSSGELQHFVFIYGVLAADVEDEAGAI